MIVHTYEVSGANIVYEVFDEEVVVVNLNSGKYYSIRNIAAYIWKAIIASLAIEIIIEHLSERYPTASEDISKDVFTFVDLMVKEGLLKASQNQPKEHQLSLPSVNYGVPTLEIFSDMQEILLLDPVHDVDESGWPITEAQLDKR